MTWRNPSYGVLHALRDAGASNITSENAITNTELGYLFDGLRPFFQFDASEADHALIIDRGAGSLTEIDWLYIPEGHNLDTDTCEITIIDDTVNTFDDQPATLLDAHQVNDTTVIDEDFDEAGSQRWVKVSFDGTGQYKFGELWLSQELAPTMGPEGDWNDGPQPNTQRIERPGGLDTLQLAADQRSIEYTYPWLGQTAADITKIENLISTCGTHLAFLLRTAFAADDGGATLVMKLIDAIEKRMPSPSPQVTGRRLAVVLRMLEVID